MHQPHECVWLREVVLDEREPALGVAVQGFSNLIWGLLVSGLLLRIFCSGFIQPLHTLGGLNFGFRITRKRWTSRMSVYGSERLSRMNVNLVWGLLFSFLSIT